MNALLSAIFLKTTLFLFKIPFRAYTYIMIKNNDQATVHPFAICYRDNDDAVKIKSFVIISKCLHHDTIAFHTFQRHLIQFIKINLTNIKKIIYFSDGANVQYKN